MNEEYVDNIKELIEEKDAAKVKELLTDLHPADIAELCNELNPQVKLICSRASLGSPFGESSFTVIPPSTALCKIP